MLRTTLTLEPDVAATLEQMKEAMGLGFKDLVNEALRIGLAGMQSRQGKKEPFHTRSVDLGPCLLPNLDDVAEALEWTEGEPSL